MQNKPLRTVLAALGAFVPVAGAGVLGNIATIPNIPVWYAGLVKPSFNPPNWIFGPVWTLLYLMMAYAFFRILQLPSATKHRTGGIGLFALQLALNAGWSWMFFGAHNIRGGFGVIILLLVLIGLTIATFLKIDRLAGLLLVPYFLWVAFASVLNFSIWQLNP